MQHRFLIRLSSSAILAVLVLASVGLTNITLAAQSDPPPYDPVAAQATLQALTAANPNSASQMQTDVGGLTFQGTLSITGAVEISAPYTVQLIDLGGIRPDLASCAVFAQGQHTPTGGSGFRLPYPDPTDTIAGHSVLVPVEVSPYPGPGNYARNHGLLLGPGVVIDDTSYFDAEPGMDYQVTVNADGSGSFNFVNLHTPSGAAAPYSTPAVSGSMTWSCSQ